MRRGGSNRTDRFYRESFSRIDIRPFDKKITPEDRLYFGGSCFAENLYGFWKERFLPASLSPFGSIYNPLSLKECFTLLASGRTIGPEELFFHRDLWNHSLFNSTVSSPDRDEMTERLNRKLMEGREKLKAASFLVLTLGTAYIYEEVSTGDVVSNCHRRPASDFRRRLLTVDECRKALEDLMTAVGELNPGVKMIISLSPVRHLRDDAAENSLSKAVLRCGIDAFLSDAEGDRAEANGSEAVYFPSYEILLDELRDYRWYADDLAHPSEAAVAYIMERFCETASGEYLEVYLKEAEKLRSLLNHRLRFPESPEGVKFTENREKALRKFAEKYPGTILPES